jgi:hypothetical protein
MGGLEERNLSASHFEGRARLDLMEFVATWIDADVPKEVTHHGDGDLRAIDWGWDVFIKIGESADLIVVSVWEEIGFHPFLVFGQIGEVRNDIVNAWCRPVRETKSTADYENVTIDIDGVARFASFVEAA